MHPLFDAPKVSNLYDNHRQWDNRHDYRNNTWYFDVFLHSLSTQYRQNRIGTPESTMFNERLPQSGNIYKIIFFFLGELVNDRNHSGNAIDIH